MSAGTPHPASATRTATAARTLRAIAALESPLWRWALSWRLRKGKETPDSVRQKWAIDAPARPEGPVVWGHGVGVGECLTLATLFQVLGERLPGHHFLITSTSRTSGAALQKALPPRCVHHFAPADTVEATQRFIRHWQPDLALWCELDLWPGLLSAAALQGTPMWLVNARVSAASAKAKRWVRPYYRLTLPLFERIYAQDEAAAQAVTMLGAPADRVRVAGTIKALARPLPVDARELAAWRLRLGERPVWLAASTHEGEEATLLEAHRLIRREHPAALLIIAPRYPARGAAVAQQAAQSMPVALRSRDQALEDRHAVYVADTIGEMGLWYRLASVAFLGGSLVPVGGHNPFEALALGCRVLHGAQVHNFSDSYEALAADGLTCLAQDPGLIARLVQQAWREGRPPPLAHWRGAQGAWRMVEDLVLMLSAPPPAPPRPASPPSARP
jgi:3-deoxy-D-manno-octulosonic-acid transferase